ncbi:MAG: lysine transporter LysE [Hyphomicrobiales bacterium]|nr:MAG: lysine transporter LysE [Hyphomicrobiales bacterium]
MTLDTWLLYVTTVLAMMSTPGPSQLLMLSNSATNGFRRSLLTACGDLTANMGQMLAAGLGLAAILLAFESALTIIKWLGVAYLLWLGSKMLWKARSGNGQIKSAPRVSNKKLWLQGFVTSATNPKAVVFFAALFPQFIDASLPFWNQFAILSATYIVIDGAFLSTYGAIAGWLAKRLKGPARLWLDRIGGSFMIGAAILLAFKSMRQVNS